jgi:hypothetical protein
MSAFNSPFSADGDFVTVSPATRLLTMALSSASSMLVVNPSNFSQWRYPNNGSDLVAPLFATNLALHLQSTTSGRLSDAVLIHIPTNFEP